MEVGVAAFQEAVEMLYRKELSVKEPGNPEPVGGPPDYKRQTKGTREGLHLNHRTLDHLSWLERSLEMSRQMAWATAIGKISKGVLVVLEKVTVRPTGNGGFDEVAGSSTFS